MDDYTILEYINSSFEDIESLLIDSSNSNMNKEIKQIMSDCKIKIEEMINEK